MGVPILILPHRIRVSKGRTEMRRSMEEKLRVGVISSTHGIRGEAKVFPTTDNPGRFKKMKEVILDTGKEEEVLEIEGVKFFKNMVIVKFKGIDDINDMEKYKGKELLQGKMPKGLGRTNILLRICLGWMWLRTPEENWGK